MKKIVPIVIVLGLVLSGLGAGAFQSDNDSDEHFISESVVLSKPVIIDMDQFVNVELSEATTLMHRTGEPNLPVVTKVFSFPFGTKIGDVSVSFSEQQSMVLDKLVIPAPMPVPLNADVETLVETTIDEVVYSNVDLYPDERFSYDIKVGLDGMDHSNFLVIRCYPIQYSPQMNTLYYSENIDIEVDYTPPADPIVFVDEYDLVIIAPEEFAGALQPLVDHKNSFGMDTFLKTTEAIYDEYTGRDEPEQIKYFIKESIEELGISFVLLVGGRVGQTFDWYLPVRNTNNHAGKPFEEGFASDLYFSDIYKVEENETVFEDWDSNGNDVFSEFTMFNRDEVDCLPDIPVGRLACRSVDEVNTMVDKIITYESSPADPSWFNKMLLMAGDTYPRVGEDAYEGELATDYSASFMDGFDFERLWASEGTLAVMKDAETAITAGAGFVHMAGHANPSILVTFPPEDENKEQKITILRMYDFRAPFRPRLRNGEKLPIIVIGGCHNSQFNVTFARFFEGLKTYKLDYFAIPGGLYWYMTWIPKCFSWWLTVKKNGGAIATMGNSGLGMGYQGYAYTTGLDGWLMPQFYKHYGENDVENVGSAHSLAIRDYALEFEINDDSADRQMIEQWVLLGDPSLMIGGYSR